MKPSRPSGPLQRLVRLRDVGYSWAGFVITALYGYAFDGLALETTAAAIWFPTLIFVYAWWVSFKPNRRAEGPGSTTPTPNDHAQES